MAAPANPIERAEAKTHLRVDHDEDDDLIDGCIATAFEYLYGEDGILGLDAPVEGESIPAPLRQAMLLHIGAIYSNRGDSTDDKSPSMRSHKALISPYKTRFVG